MLSFSFCCILLIVGPRIGCQICQFSCIDFASSPLFWAFQACLSLSNCCVQLPLRPSTGPLNVGSSAKVIPAGCGPWGSASKFLFSLVELQWAKFYCTVQFNSQLDFRQVIQKGVELQKRFSGLIC